jgi:hypothetical protein
MSRMMDWVQRWRKDGNTEKSGQQGLFAVRENDLSWGIDARTARDRYPSSREEVLEQALEAWRTNPLARRIVELTTQYVVGGGVSVSCAHPATARFIHTFWDHPLNRMDVRTAEWCDELTRTGNLFIVVSTDASGMSFVRALPASSIQRIACRENDVEQTTTVYPKPTADFPDPAPWRVYSEKEDNPREGGGFEAVALHYAINRPVGAQWGEPDLAPLLRWMARYSSWLEDRARLNRYRNTFLFLVKGRYSSEAERLARQQSLNGSPPPPGSVLVLNESDEWSVISPKLESSDANLDGLALKKMIAAGAGLPMHFLAEPESATRTTAEAAGGPTYRRFEQRQRYFIWMLGDILRVIVRRKAMVDRRVCADADIELNGADISARDNVALSMAAGNIVTAFGQMRAQGLIDDAELVRMVYRFAGETADVQELLAAARKAATHKATSNPTGGHPRGAVDPFSGEPQPASNGGETI